MSKLTYIQKNKNQIAGKIVLLVLFISILLPLMKNAKEMNLGLNLIISICLLAIMSSALFIIGVDWKDVKKRWGEEKPILIDYKKMTPYLFRPIGLYASIGAFCTYGYTYPKIQILTAIFIFTICEYKGLKDVSRIVLSIFSFFLGSTLVLAMKYFFL